MVVTNLGGDFEGIRGNLEGDPVALMHGEYVPLECGAVADNDVCTVFTADFPAGDVELTATMLDARQKEIGSAYYAYVRPADRP